ncbi:MAG: hypothetical protein FJ404_08370 [Verrucomicrobia bacterium]|nr:hypothetical protein [Verrucomicrobiota bacterium]
MFVVWRRLPSLPYRRLPGGPAGEEPGPSMLSTRLVSFVAPQAGQPALQQTGMYENILTGEESEANNASRARSKSQQKGYEISGPGREESIAGAT